MNIKVGSTGATKSVGSTRKSARSSAAEGAFASLLQETEEPSVASVGPSTGVGGIEALLAAQMVDDALEGEGRKKRAAARGNDILDRLEELRTDILSGTVSKAKLIQLAQILRDKREAGLDDELNQILDDIELRAEVELAKLEDSV